MKVALSRKLQGKKRKVCEWGNMRAMKWIRENWGVPLPGTFETIPELREELRYAR